MRDARGHEWIETSDPLTPMCSRCQILDGAHAAWEPCPADRPFMPHRLPEWLVPTLTWIAVPLLAALGAVMLFAR